MTSFPLSLLLSPAPRTIIAPGGAGARTVIFTVTLGGVGVLGASVRLSRGAETFVLPTDAQGQATFHVDDGEWGYVVTKTLCAPQAGVIQVEGNQAQGVALQTIALPVSPDPDRVPLLFESVALGGPAVRTSFSLKIIGDGPTILQGRSITQFSFKGQTDENGSETLHVFPSSTLQEAGISGEYEVTWDAARYAGGTPRRFLVPDAGGRLADLLED